MTDHNPPDGAEPDRSAEYERARRALAPMTDDERVLAAHRWAARVNFGTDIAHVAMAARRALGVARYSCLVVPGEVVDAVEVLERWAVRIAGQVGHEQRDFAASGMDSADFQRRLEGGEPEHGLGTI